MKNRYPFILPIIGCLCLLFAACHVGSTKTDGSFFPAIAYDPVNGRYLSVFVKTQAANSHRDRISAVFIDGNGSLLGSEFVISEEDAGYECPAVSYDELHAKFLVVWYSDGEVYGQFIDADGNLSGARITVSDGKETSCSAVSYIGAGQKFVMVWGEKSTSQDNIYAQFINADGSYDGLRQTVSSDGALSAHPSIAYDEQLQRFLVVWDSADNVKIKGRIINPDGTFAAQEIVISATSGVHSRPIAVYNSVDAQFLVTWEDTGTADISSLVGQLLNADGSSYQSAISISTAGRNVHGHASLYNASAGNYFVLFGDRSQDAEMLYSQVVTTAGTLDRTISNDNTLISYADYPGDKYPAAAYDVRTKKFFSVWEYGLGGDHDAFSDIHGRLVNADGSPAGDITVISNGGQW